MCDFLSAAGTSFVSCPPLPTQQRCGHPVTRGNHNNNGSAASSGPQGPEQVLIYGVDIQVAHFQCRPACTLSTNSISPSFTETPPTRATPPSLFNERPAAPGRLVQSPPAVEETTNGLALLCGASLLWFLLERYGTG